MHQSTNYNQLFMRRKGTAVPSTGRIRNHQLVVYLGQLSQTVIGSLISEKPNQTRFSCCECCHMCHPTYCWRCQDKRRVYIYKFRNWFQLGEPVNRHVRCEVLMRPISHLVVGHPLSLSGRVWRKRHLLSASTSVNTFLIIQLTHPRNFHDWFALQSPIMESHMIPLIQLNQRWSLDENHIAVEIECVCVYVFHAIFSLWHVKRLLVLALYNSKFPFFVIYLYLIRTRQTEKKYYNIILS
jgi:hypothetical protein